MKKAYLFPGQGSQVVGMGETLFDKFNDLVHQADNILGYSIKELCLTDPHQQLTLTQYTQPALFVVNALSYLKTLEDTGSKPDYVAGHSLGEYNALFASGAVSFETGLKLVKKRGQLMAAARNGGMAAVVGLKEDKVKSIIEQNGLVTIDIANLNSPTQIVISGPLKDIQNAQSFFERENAMYIPLKVSGAFHSRLMEEARQEFIGYIDQFTFNPLSIPVISNVTARPYKFENISRLLTDQITHSVKWTESMCYLMGKGVEEFAEIGPGKVLAGLMKKIQREAEPLIVAEEEVKPVSKPGPPVNAAAGPGTSPQSSNDPQVVFMYSGQGSHYYNMGKELFEKNEVFRRHMNTCSNLLKNDLQESLTDVIYDSTKRFQEFNDILYTHPALFSIQYSLTQVLYDMGIHPSKVLGYSMGEYVGAVVAGALSLEEGLKLVVNQARYLHSKCSEGGMLVILEKPDNIADRGQFFRNCTIAAENYDGNFVISGSKENLKTIHSMLNERSVFSVLLPVNYAFHSAWIDPFKDDFAAFLKGLSFKPLQIPLCSSETVGEISHLTDQYLWDIIRNKIRFRELIASMNASGNFLFVDVSPTGSLAGFIKHGFKGEIPAFVSMNQFGQNINALEALRRDLKKVYVA
jgi:malonyl CoA-acyl carrier protein transacylase